MQRSLWCTTAIVTTRIVAWLGDHAQHYTTMLSTSLFIVSIGREVMQLGCMLALEKSGIRMEMQEIKFAIICIDLKSKVWQQ